MIAAKNARIKLSAALDRKDVLRGATVVLTTIGVGKRRAWEQDVFVPRKHGIYMPVGDTVGPGGTSRALRMVPAMVAIARDVLDLCPEALFFNYANPMAIICRAVRKATGAPVVGLCHGTHDTAHYLAEHLGVERSELVYTAVGINHMTWFTDVRIGAVSAMPQMNAIAAGVLARLAETLAAQQAGQSSPRPGGAFGSSFDFPFAWQCLQWFGAFPAPLDRHVCEFFPQFFRTGSYYGKTLGVDEFSFEGTIAEGDRIFAEMERDAFAAGPLGADYFEKLGGEHEQVIEIIQSIRANRNKIYAANLPNTGQVSNLPLGAVIEAPAVSDARGLHPLQVPPLSPAVAGTLATRFAWVEATVEAALEKSRDKFIQALILDGAVTAPDVAVALADDLLAAQREYLHW
jgi:alpha-galactosidase